MKYLNLPQLPVVSALPASSVAGRGRICVLLGDLHVYCDNGTTWDDLTAQGTGGGGGGGSTTGLTGYTITGSPAINRSLDRDTANLGAVVEVLSTVINDMPVAPGLPTGYLFVGITSVSGNYTILASDVGKLIVASAAAVITVPTGLGLGFNCAIMGSSSGIVSVAAGAGAALNHRLNHTKTAGQYAVANVFAYAVDMFALAGDTIL